MRLTPFRYDFNRERFFYLSAGRASLETDPDFYPLSTKGFQQSTPPQCIAETRFSPRETVLEN